jgi:hypothetical protein
MLKDGKAILMLVVAMTGATAFSLNSRTFLNNNCSAANAFLAFPERNVSYAHQLDQCM